MTQSPVLSGGILQKIVTRKWTTMVKQQRKLAVEMSSPQFPNSLFGRLFRMELDAWLKVIESSQIYFHWINETSVVNFILAAWTIIR